MIGIQINILFKLKGLNSKAASTEVKMFKTQKEN